MDQDRKTALQNLFRDWSGENLTGFIKIEGSGSNRQYYRISSEGQTAIGVIGEDADENRAFFNFTEHFRRHGLNVPEIYDIDTNEGIYLIQDLGDISLFSLLPGLVADKVQAGRLESVYKRVLDHLIQFQVVAGKDLDYTVCFPRDTFDRQSLQWDLNYFKYYYLKLAYIPFHEQALENDFTTLTGFLVPVDSSYFMYRDFQARNIMMVNNEPWFIDYQGGRRGPLQYDVASLLFQAKAGLPSAFREKMLEYYISQLNKYIPADRNLFIPLYYGFVLVRTLQVLGAYGYRGYYERKPHFIESIGYALENIEWLLENVEFPFHIPELMGCLKEMVKQNSIHKICRGSEKLTVVINSFSYLQNGLPEDKSGHGGGFVFDCRALPNPGRIPEFKNLSGLDQAVIGFMSRYNEVESFNDEVFAIISRAVENYLDRNFDHLMVSFGCTGGQHRSVYCSEELYEKLTENFRINIKINHTMKDKW
ncbi:MAG: phosphotransferase enzyme family protein [Bacteroidetes bacterium]|nr:phosphotransferase enzyme family protein [Bacteroidota bacterium]